MNKDQFTATSAVTAPCVQCGKPGVAGIETAPGEGYNLCFEHMQEYKKLRLQEMEFYAARADSWKTKSTTHGACPEGRDRNRHRG